MNGWPLWRAANVSMLQALSDPILPIFAILVVGFIMRRADLFTPDHATAINRYVFYLGTPALVFSVLVSVPADNIIWPVLLRYLAAELITYGLIAALAYYVFKRGPREAILLGMAASFANHIFFVRPIAVLLYGDSASHPISGIVMFDVLIFCTTVFAMDILSPKNKGLGGALRSLGRNPFVYAPIIAIAYRALGDLAPSGIATFANFAGASASPTSLFTLGVILAGLRLNKLGLVIWVVVFGKLLLHPLLFWLMSSAAPIAGTWGIVPLLVAAGPCGAMAFVIAMQYGVKTDLIAKTILISTILSVLSLSVLTQ